MAVKLSSYYWFRNNSLVRSLEDVHAARYLFGEDLSDGDKNTLQFIIGLNQISSSRKSTVVNGLGAACGNLKQVYTPTTM